MKWYILVEGRQTEKKIYQSWLGVAFPDLQPVERVEDMDEGRYYLVKGGGYPSYIDRIKNAVAQMVENPSSFDHLVICVDAEELSLVERRSQVEDILEENACPVPYSIVVQDCCIETWLLGNVRFAKSNPQSQRLRDYYAHYDVQLHDPEGLPKVAGFNTRAQFHLDYLREMFRERGLVYSKRQPGKARERTYLQELITRHEQTGHLASFGVLLASWREHGGQI